MSATKQAAVSGTSFDEALPDAPINSLHEYAELPYKRVTQAAPCVICTTPTRWRSVAFDLRICSPDCADKLWDAYYAKVEESGGVDVGFADD